MKHLSKEILLSYIDGNIKKNQRDECEKYFSNCIQCFTLYASYKQAHHEIVSSKLEKTPTYLLNRVMFSEKYNLTTSEVRTKPKKFDGFIQKMKLLLSPKLIPAGLTLMLFIAIFRIYEPATNYSSNEIDPSNDNLRDWQQPEKVLSQVDKKYNYEIITFYAPKKQKNITNEIKFRVPDFSNKSLNYIKKTLQKNQIKHIIYRSIQFKQIPQPGVYLSNNDTLKIFINLDDN